MYSNAPSVIFDQPQVPLLNTDVYKTVLSPKVPLCEITAMVIFLEYFADSKEKEYLVSDYLESLYARFKEYDVGNMHLKKIPRHLLSLGIPLEFDVYMYEYDYRQPWTYEQRLYAYYRRKEMAEVYNGVAEKLAKLYSSIKDYYSSSSYFRNLMKGLQSKFMGYFPKVTQTGEASFSLTFIENSVM